MCDIHCYTALRVRCVLIGSVFDVILLCVYIHICINLYICMYIYRCVFVYKNTHIHKHADMRSLMKGTNSEKSVVKQCRLCVKLYLNTPKTVQYNIMHTGCMV